MYLDPPAVSTPIRVPAFPAAVLGCLVLGILAVGVLQEPFLTRITAAIQF
jgi:hypothetical protein